MYICICIYGHYLIAFINSRNMLALSTRQFVDLVYNDMTYLYISNKINYFSLIMIFLVVLIMI